MTNHSSDFTLPADVPEFSLIRVFDAPRALLWTCWTEPGHVSRWWGPKPFTCPVSEIDARVGGTFRLVVRSPGGDDYAMSGIFREIVPQQKFVKEDDVSEHSEAWHDMVDPDRRGQGKRRIDILTTVTFEDQATEEGMGTKITIYTRLPSVTIRDNFASFGLKEAWDSSFGKLDDLANALKGNDREINIVRDIQAPIARVFAAFSDPDGMAQWWGPNGFTTTTHKMDFRIGGTWTYTMHGPDGTDYPNHVAYTSIVPERNIAYDHGTHPDQPALFKALISFEPRGNETRVSLRLTLGSAAERPGYVAFGAVEGGYQNLERLNAFLKAQH